MACDACDQIGNLIHRYSEAVDGGRFDVLDELFADPGRGIEIIATARYEDSFRRVGGTWRFSDRAIRHSSLDGVHRDFIGDMSRHMRKASGPASQSAKMSPTES